MITNTYLAMLTSAGLDYALMDILDEGLVQTARTAGVLAHENLFAWEMIPGA